MGLFSSGNNSARGRNVAGGKKYGRTNGTGKSGRRSQKIVCEICEEEVVVELPPGSTHFIEYYADNGKKHNPQTCSR